MMSTARDRRSEMLSPAQDQGPEMMGLAAVLVPDMPRPSLDRGTGPR